MTLREQLVELEQRYEAAPVPVRIATAAYIRPLLDLLTAIIDRLEKEPKP